MAQDHCTQLVGMNMEDNYWIVRNSWGTDWGEQVGSFSFITLLSVLQQCESGLHQNSTRQQSMHGETVCTVGIFVGQSG